MKFPLLFKYFLLLLLTYTQYSFYKVNNELNYIMTKHTKNKITLHFNYLFLEESFSCEYTDCFYFVIVKLLGLPLEIF